MGAAYVAVLPLLVCLISPLPNWNCVAPCLKELIGRAHFGPRWGFDGLGMAWKLPPFFGLPVGLLWLTYGPHRVTM